MSASVQSLLTETILSLALTWMVKEGGAEAQDSIEAVIGLLQGCDDTAVAHPEEEGAECVCTVRAVQPDLGSLLWTSSKDSG